MGGHRKWRRLFPPPVQHTHICGHFVKTEVKGKDEERIERKEEQEEEMFVVCPNPSLPLLLPLFGGSRILKNGNERWKRREEEGMLKGSPPHFFLPLAAQKNGGEEGNLIWHSDSVRRTFSPPSRAKVFSWEGRGRKVLLLFSGYKKDKSLILLPGNMSLLKTREHTQSIGRAKKECLPRGCEKENREVREEEMPTPSEPPGKENHLAPAPRTHLQIHTS